MQGNRINCAVCGVNDTDRRTHAIVCQGIQNEMTKKEKSLQRIIHWAQDIGIARQPQYAPLPFPANYTRASVVKYFRDGTNLIRITNILWNRNNTAYIYPAAENLMIINHNKVADIFRNSGIVGYNPQLLVKGREVTPVLASLCDIYIKRDQLGLKGRYLTQKLEGYYDDTTREREAKNGKKGYEAFLSKYYHMPSFSSIYLLLDEGVLKGKPMTFELFVAAVFYCGKGGGDRAGQHMKDVREEGDTRTADRKHDTIRHIWREKNRVGVCVMFNIPDKVAFGLESCLITLFGLFELVNKIDGHKTVQHLPTNYDEMCPIGIYALHKLYKRYGSHEKIPYIGK